MSNINVPDFKQFEDFSKWVSDLPEQEIQQWNTADWNKMFEKLSAYVNNSKEIEIARKIKNLTCLKSKYSKDDIFCGNKENLLALAKLYKNFRFEPQQLKNIRNLAKQAGALLAQDTQVHIERIATAPYSQCQEEYTYIAQKISDIVLQQSDYSDEDKEKMRAEIVYNPKLKFGGDTLFQNKKNRTRISHGDGEDFFVEIMMHECAHAYLQISGENQKELWKQGKKPLNNMDDDFAKLLQYNARFNLNLDWDKIPEEYYKFMNDGYRKQPMEKFSYVYGVEAERAYRRSSEKYSERTATVVAVLLNEFCGWPTTAEETKDATVLKYKNKIPPEELMNRVSYIFAPIKNSNIEKAFNVHINNENEMEMKIPNIYKCKDLLVMYYQYITSNENMRLSAYLQNQSTNKADNSAGLIDRSR